MTFAEYAAGVRLHMLAPPESRLACYGLGLTGEAGETVEHVKKHLFHGKPLDAARMAEELGDVLFYAEALAQTIGTTLADVAAGNLAKLAARYPAHLARTVER